MSDNISDEKQSAEDRSFPIGRREYLATTGLLASPAIASGQVGATTNGARSGETDDGSTEPLSAPANLRVEYEQSPNNLDPDSPPRFSWEVQTTSRDRTQSAYRILVASSKSKLNGDTGDIWDSGKVESATSTNVPLESGDLTPDTTYHWKVHVWDGAGQATPWSESAQFTTSLPAGDEHWDGSWIGSPTAPEDDSEAPHPAPLLRQEVSFDEAVETARLHVSGLGFYDLQINGEQVGDRVLDPGRTDYEDTVLYSTYDVSEYFTEGDNAIGVELGRGRFGELIEDFWDWSDAPWWSDPQLLVQLNVEFVDGTSTSVVTDESWSVIDGPTRHDSLYGGDTYDAREERPGWATPGFDDSDWDDAVTVAPPDGEITPQRVQPIEITDTYEPVEMTEPEDGVYVFDIGEQLAGWVELTVEGPEGTEVTITHGESLDEGYVNNDNIHLESPVQVDRYTLKGENTETWEPKFSYKGFRYVQLDGFPGEPSLDSITAKELHTTVEEGVDSDFDSSNELLNWIHENTQEAILTNLHSVFTDTPTYEKNGWTGDIRVSAETATQNFWMPRFWRKFLRDCADAQEDDGNVPYIVPTAGYGEDDNDPAWDAAYVFVPWYAYQYYGDERLLREHYKGMKAYVDYARGTTDDHIVRDGYGDWAAPGGNIPPEGAGIVSTSCYYRSAEIVADTAELLGKDADAAEYRSLASDIKTAFNDEFFDPETSVYSTGEVDEYRQTSNVYPLAYDIAPDEHEEAIAENLREDVMVTQDGHLNVGTHGLQYLFPVLTEYGYHEAAMTAATQDTFPSWGNWRENGEVSLLEFWDTGARSKTHHFLGSIDQWFYQYLAGIRAPDEPGFRELTIKPHVPEDLDEASAITETVRGTVASGWSQDGDLLSLDVSIPWNATAEVHVPARYAQGVIESDTPSLDVPAISFDRLGDEHVVFEVGSGEYSFTSDPVRGSIGYARDTAESQLAELNDLQSRTKPLQTKLEKFIGQAEAAVSARDDGNEEDVVRFVHKALITVNQLDENLDGGASQLQSAVSTLHDEMSYASGLLLDPDGELTVEGQVFSGGTTRVSAAIHNGGDEKINDLELSVDPPGGWTVSPVSRTHAGNLKPGETFVAEFDADVPLAQPANEGPVQLTGTASYRYKGGTAERPLTTTTAVKSPVRFADLSGADVHPGEQTTVEATVENRIADPVSGTVSLDLPDGWSATTEQKPYEVGGRGSTSVPISVTAAEDAERGSDTRLGATVTYPGGVGDRTTVGVYVPFGPVPDGFAEFASTDARMGMADGEFVIDANGNELSSSSDEFGAIYVEDGLDSEGTVVAKLSSLENQRDFANKAGLMVKNDMTKPGESTGYVVLGLFPPGLSWLEWDSDDDGYLDDGSGWSELWPPCWLKIERDGTTFTGYQSTDGSTWEEVGSTTVESAVEVQDVGMFSTSSTPDVLNRADFAEFEIS